MKGWEKITLTALALCALLLAGVLVLRASAASGTVHLMAVNDKVLVDLTAENMPTVIGGALYVPYTMLSNRVHGYNLGVNAMYSSSRHTVMVSDGVRGVVFDPQTSTAQDLGGEAMPVRAMVRNSMVFLPIDWLCEYFGTISCSRIRTQYGIVVRVTNGAAVLDDANFVSAADSLLSDSLQRYLSTVDPLSPAVPSAAQPDPSAAPDWAELYLAFRWGEQAGETARLLEERGERALFLFTCGQLREQDGLVRELVGAGHTVGLALTGDDAADCRAQAEEGGLLLAAIARYPLLVVSADGLDGEGRETLAQEGYVVWAAGSRGEGYSSGAALVRDLDPQEVNLVELSCGPGGAAFARGMLRAMDESGCRAYQFTAASLGPAA